MVVRICTKCAHQWAPRKDEPPKKCPRCQAPYEPAIAPAETETRAPFADATTGELRLLAAVLEIIRSDDAAAVAAIKAAASHWRRYHPL